ncbi:MAG TPA: ATP-binding protein [Thermoanaerobaculia bacterium]|jgi:PAS domain S-box-containing protein|nr:ATP-binding protein [Thermoanaerobaculia bacterium]
MTMKMDVEELRLRLEEAEETLRAIRHGEVDALVVTESRGERVYTLKSADRPYRLMIEGMRQGAVTLTAEGLVLYCNACFSSMLKLPLESLIGSHIERHVSEASRGAFAELLRPGGQGQGEILLETGDGSRLPAYVAFSELPLDEPGEPVLCMVVTDLTEQKKSEQLKQAWAAAEEMNLAKDHFLATLSHELRTPLTPVLALISALEESDRLPPELRGAISMVRRNVELEARLIDDLLDLTRVSSGKLQLDRRDVDLRAVIEHAVQTSCAEEMATGRRRIVVELADEDHHIWGDAPRLTQVFWNLLNNAVKFTPEGATIAVRSRREAPGRFVVEVSDTGVGIDPEVLPRIFDAFEQGEASVTRRYGGLGLGLAISRTIVELHGGSISVSSEGRERGTTFLVQLPVGPRRAESTEPAVAPPARISGQAPAHLRILLVEDHSDTASALADLLRMQGHRVRVAATIAQALDLADKGDLDLVVSDLGLPDGSGQDLMRSLSQRYQLRGIALSGYGMEDDIRRSREAGFEQHLTKPVNLQALEAAIQQVAATRAAQETARS